MAFIEATNIDDIRIEVLGESRAVRATGGQWVDFRDRGRVLEGVVQDLLAACQTAATQLQWHVDNPGCVSITDRLTLDKINAAIAGAEAAMEVVR